jgi:hypothetical protein
MKHIFGRTAGKVAKRFRSKKPFYRAFQRMATSVIDEYQAAPLLRNSKAPSNNVATSCQLVKVLTGFVGLAHSLYRTPNFKKFETVLRAQTTNEYLRLLVNNLANFSHLADKILDIIAQYEEVVTPSEIRSKAND